MKKIYSKIVAIVLMVAMVASMIPETTLRVLAEEAQEQPKATIPMQEVQPYGASSTITEEQLYMLAPDYLVNEPYNNIIATCGDMATEAMDSVSETEETLAAIMYSLKSGESFLWKEIMSACGMNDDMYTDFKKKAALELVKEYTSVEGNLVKAGEKIEKDFAFIKNIYDFESELGKQTFKQIMMENNPKLTSEQTGEMLDAIFAETDTLMKYVSNTTELFVLVMSIIEMQMIEVQMLDDLIAVQSHIKDTAVRDALTEVRIEITENIAMYVINNYVREEALDWLKGLLKSAVSGLVKDYTNFEISGLTKLISKVTVKVIVNIYEKFNPSVSDIMYSTILYSYWQNSNTTVTHYEAMFRLHKLTEDNIREYKAAINFNVACTKLLLSKSKNLVKSSNKRLYNKIDMWTESLGSSVNYDVYIAKCLSNAQAAIDEGTLTITEDSATVTDKNGTVIDETYDSTESIAAKFAAIQSQYKPNVGQTWTSEWGGAIQCFGFARMVFYNIFGCNMPACYYGEAPYEYTNTNNVTMVGQVTGSDVTEDSAKALLQQGKLGDIIQAAGATYGQHTMIFVSADDSGVTVYDCNAHLNSSEPDCVIHQWTINWSTWASWYGSGGSNGITLYRAANYAQIYGDGDGMFYDDSVNFVIEDGVLTKYNGWQSMVEIPDTVTAIGDSAFENNRNMMSVSIPDSVESIGANAFSGCSSLLGVVIPDSVESIGNSAFYNCTKLSSVYLPNNEKFVQIAGSTFSNCTSLGSVEISDSVTYIGSYAFSNCENLSSVKLSKGLEELGTAAFSNCKSLMEIEIPKSLTEAHTYMDYWRGSGPFSNCEKLRNITFEIGITEISCHLFEGCTGITEIEIPDTVTKIEAGAFYGCNNLVELKIGENVTEIGSTAFSSCTNLEKLKIPDSVVKISGNAFQNCTKLSVVELSKSLEDLGDSAFGGCVSLTAIEIPKSLSVAHTYMDYYRGSGPFESCEKLASITFEAGITKICGHLFEGCTGIREIEIPDTVTKIEGGAFYQCSNLVEVRLSDNITEIGNTAFYNCDALTEIVIPDSVTKIGNAAFSGCENLSSVTLSKNLEQLGSEAFRSCKKLTEIEIPKSLDSCSTSLGPFAECDNLKTVKFEEGTTQIAYGVFADCSGIESVEIPNTVTVIENYAFVACENLKEVTIPDSVIQIDYRAFSSCPNLTEIYIPDSVTAMGNAVFSECTGLEKVHLPNIRQNIMQNTFYNCKNLTEINFPDTLTTIQSYAFYGCTSLPEAVLPDKVTRIENSAFEGCSALTKVVVPDAVTYMGSYAFKGCEALTDVTLGSGLQNIYTQTFMDCAALESIVVPYYVTEIGTEAFKNCTSLTAITIPRKTTSIASNAFSYPKKMTIYGVSDSYAQEYAAEKGITFVAQDIPATAITISETSKSVYKYEDFQLSITVTPANFTDEVIWTSSNEDVATVSEDGYVETLRGGTTVITVTAGNVTASCQVNVIQQINSIYFDEWDVYMEAGETYQLTVDIYPSDATNKQLTYTSSKPDVAIVSSTGKVTALKEGSTKITATATDGSEEYDTCWIYVSGSISEDNNGNGGVTGDVKVSSITLNSSIMTLEKGKTYTLQSMALPTNATNKAIFWQTSNPAVATVSSTGLVTAISGGTAILTALAQDGSGVSAICMVTVPYTITYNLNGGNNNVANPATYSSEEVNLKNPTRKGYAFKGWYTDSQYVNKITTITQGNAADYTLYAKWSKITVKKATLKAAKNVKGKKIKVTIKKLSGVKGYEISYSTSKKFAKGKTKIKCITKNSYTLTKLKKNKKYYVRVRAYTLDSAGNKVYGKYSNVKTVTIRK